MIRERIHNELLQRLKEKRRFIQVLAGPRQVGKTTLVRQVMAATKRSFPEMREAFGFTLEQYIFYGAYPGAAELIGAPERERAG